MSIAISRAVTAAQARSACLGTMASKANGYLSLVRDVLDCSLQSLHLGTQWLEKTQGRHNVQMLNNAAKDLCFLDNCLQAATTVSYWCRLASGELLHKTDDLGFLTHNKDGKPVKKPLLSLVSSISILASKTCSTVSNVLGNMTLINASAAHASKIGSVATVLTASLDTVAAAADTVDAGQRLFNNRVYECNLHQDHEACSCDIRDKVAHKRETYRNIFLDLVASVLWLIGSVLTLLIVHPIVTPVVWLFTSIFNIARDIRDL